MGVAEFYEGAVTLSSIERDTGEVRARKLKDGSLDIRYYYLERGTDELKPSQKGIIIKPVELAWLASVLDVANGSV